MNWYLAALKKYATFSGRARRKEYWYFVLFNFIFAIVAIVLDAVLGIASNDGGGPIYLIYVLGTLLPGIAVMVRRLHDTGKSGWYVFVSIIPIIGSIWLLVLMVSDSDSYENEYGPNPKEIETSIFA